LKHIKAFSLKLVALLVLSFIILNIIFEMPGDSVFAIALITAILIYILGDLVILKNSGNMVATFVDAGAAFVISVAYLTAMTDGEAIVASFVFALGVALFETFFHNWLLKDQSGSSRSPY
jgi:uncharacterized protein YhhL (DUF1145 family)